MSSSVSTREEHVRQIVSQAPSAERRSISISIQKKAW